MENVLSQEFYVGELMQNVNTTFPKLTNEIDEILKLTKFRHFYFDENFFFVHWSFVSKYKILRITKTVFEYDW